MSRDKNTLSTDFFNLLFHLKTNTLRVNIIELTIINLESRIKIKIVEDELGSMFNFFFF